MKKIILLVSFMSLSVNLSLAQNNEKDNWVNISDFAPKSPESRAFQKYGDYNVNLAKGLVNVSVPFYTLAAGDYKLPIELSYNPSGIKINQDATWVGLGWSLKAGAQITLDIRDSPDETIDIPMPDPSAVNTYLANAAPWDYCDPYMHTLRTNSWVKDVYHFSSPTAQGKFVLGDSQGEDNIHVYPPEAFKVETEGNKHDRRFKITDTQGNIYFFNNTREKSKSIGIAHDTNYYTTAWYVDQIKTPLNNIIDFTYTNDGWHSQLSVNDQIMITDVENDCDPGALNTQILNSSVSRNSTTATKTYKITSITFKNLRILFTGQTGRLDLASPSLLEKARFPTENVVPSYLKFIKIQSKTNEIYNDIKGYELLYSYFDAGGTELEYFRKRLKLEAVIDITDENIATRFKYSDVNLPAKNSRSSDAWGYCNGVNNLTLVPPQHTYVNGAMVTLGQAYRNVNSNAAQAGILTEIKYPTKGKTKFNYESNMYYGIDELNKSNEIIINSHYVQGTGIPEGPPFEDCDETSTCVVYHSIPYNVGGSASARLSFEMVYTGGNILTQNKYQYAKVSVYSYTTGTKIYSETRKYSLSFDVAITLQGSGYIMIEAYGKYMGVKNFQCKYIDNDYTPKNVLGPGLRIASIENYINDATLVTKKKYTYTIPGELNKSSGKLIFDSVRKFDAQRFGSLEVVMCPGEPAPSGIFWKQNITNVYNGQSPYFAMNEVYYTDVKEEEINIETGANKGYTTYNYDFMQSSSSQDGAINIEYDWRRGNLLNKKIYNSNNKIIQEEVNNYVEDNAKTSVVAGFKLYSRYTYATCPTQTNFTSINPFEKMGYSYTIPWHYLKSKQITETLYNKTNEVSGTIISKTTFNYNNPSHLQLSSQTTTSSTGETIESKFFYAGDSEVAGRPFVNELIEAHMIGIPLDTQTFKSGTKLSEQLTMYDKSSSSNNLLLPKSVYINKGSGIIDLSADKKITYDQYDEQGNILQYTPESGIPVSIIWGYNKTQPIAKIENIAYSSIPQATITNLQSLSNEDSDNCLSENCTEQLLRNALNIFRNSFPDAFISTYTYNPIFGVTSVTDQKRNTTYYEYDTYGRLKFVKDKDLNVLQKYCYNYKGESVDCSDNSSTTIVLYRSIARSGSFTRNNCASGGTGSRVSYSQAEGVETSTISQADADALGLSRFNNDGQANANTNGSCTFSSIARSGFFTRNNCASGGTGSSVSYSQAEGAVTSTVSQADADALGLSKFDTDGQANANTNGICTLPLPAAPTGLTLTGKTTTSLNFSWTAVAGATSYKIYKNGSDTGITTSASTGTLSGLTSDTAYSIQVLAVNAAGDGALSTAVSMHTDPTIATNACVLDFHRTGGSCKVYKNGSVYLSATTSGISNGTLTTGDTFFVTVTASAVYYKGITITSSVRGILYNYDPNKIGTSTTSPTFTKQGSEEIQIYCYSDTLL